MVSVTVLTPVLPHLLLLLLLLLSLQSMVSSNDPAPELQKIFRPGNIITARIYDTGTTDTGVDELQRRRCEL
jgi:hypothetical protein